MEGVSQTFLITQNLNIYLAKEINCNIPIDMWKVHSFQLSNLLNKEHPYCKNYITKQKTYSPISIVSTKKKNHILQT